MGWHSADEKPPADGLYKRGNDEHYILSYWTGEKWVKPLKRDEESDLALAWKDRE